MLSLGLGAGVSLTAGWVSLGVGVGVVLPLGLGAGVSVAPGDGLVLGVSEALALGDGLVPEEGAVLEVPEPEELEFLFLTQLLYLVSSSTPLVQPRVPSSLTYMMSSSRELSSSR